MQTWRNLTPRERIALAFYTGHAQIVLLVLFLAGYIGLALAGLP